MATKRLCCQNLAYRQTEIKWSFFVEHLNSWIAVITSDIFVLFNEVVINKEK
jgi:hypothetical protein